MTAPLDARAVRSHADLALLVTAAQASQPPAALAGLEPRWAPALAALAPAGLPLTPPLTAAPPPLPDLQALLIDGPPPPLRADALLAAWHAPSPDPRQTVQLCRARAALGQPEAGAARLSSGAPPGGIDGALWAWALGDLRSARGDRSGAARAWEDAAAWLRSARALPLLARLCRRRADRLAAAGQRGAAARHYREAGALYRQLDLPAGRAATLRGLADLAVSGAEVLRADELYAQAEALRPPEAERANIELGRAGLAIARGELAAAAASLDPLAGPLTAPRRRRAAELALREGQHERARALADAAEAAWARVGEAGAAAACARLRGDIEAARGDRAEAQRLYLEAAEAQARAGDALGLRRTLLHGLRLAVDGGPGLLAPAAWRALADLLDEADEGAAAGA